jgi:membrane protease YdiL (CAAX protease family)
MTLLTYPVFDFAVSLFPGLEAQVAALYRAARTTTLPVALAWVTLIICAEEFLWRGALFGALARRNSTFAAVTWCVASYVMAQLGTGSWVVGAMAAVCGTLWTLQRKLSRSLLAPLLAHLIWTPTVILLRPVISCGLANGMSG